MRSALLFFGVAALLQSASAVIRVSAIGDSITAGVCSKATHGYPAVLQSLLGSGYVVGNYGNSGKTMLTQGLCGPPPSSNCSYVGTSTWPSALASTPDLVTIMLGTNDAKEFNWFGIQGGVNPPDSYFLDYISMIKTLKKLDPVPKIVVLTLVPLEPNYPYDMNQTVINTILSGPKGLLFQLAALEADSIIDVNAAWVAAGLNQTDTCDGCHPTDTGYEFIGQVLAKAIQAMYPSVPADLRPLDEVRQAYDTPAFQQMAMRVNSPASCDDRCPASYAKVE